MNQNTLRTIVTVAVMVVVFAIAMSILKALIKILLPLSIIIVAAYVVYKLINRPKY